MGNYLNPGNEAFKRITNSKYIDKTGVIGLMNERIESFCLHLDDCRPFSRNGSKPLLIYFSLLAQAFPKSMRLK